MIGLLFQYFLIILISTYSIFFSQKPSNESINNHNKIYKKPNFINKKLSKKTNSIKKNSKKSYSDNLLFNSFFFQAVDEKKNSDHLFQVIKNNRKNRERKKSLKRARYTKNEQIKETWIYKVDQGRRQLIKSVNNLRNSTEFLVMKPIIIGIIGVTLGITLLIKLVFKKQNTLLVVRQINFEAGELVKPILSNEFLLALETNKKNIDSHIKDIKEIHNQQDLSKKEIHDLQVKNINAFYNIESFVNTFIDKFSLSATHIDMNKNFIFLFQNKLNLNIESACKNIRNLAIFRNLDLIIKPFIFQQLSEFLLSDSWVIPDFLKKVNPLSQKNIFNNYYLRDRDIYKILLVPKTNKNNISIENQWEDIINFFKVFANSIKEEDINKQKDLLKQSQRIFYDLGLLIIHDSETQIQKILDVAYDDFVLIKEKESEELVKKLKKYNPLFKNHDSKEIIHEWLYGIFQNLSLKLINNIINGKE